jgi:indolepyruvate ferredoxin oxidoreductase alpha subunit
MGNEAIALGAIRAGVSVVTGYPGTPSTEILETVVRERPSPEQIYVEWSVNEKAALEVAAGAAYAGARAMVTMKQVGLNVASDPLMSLNYVGVAGGLVVAVADDPGPISSQTEQDTRHFARYAKLAVFDPSTPEEAYTMIARAFDCSEKYGRPVILRPTTRVCHSYASVEMLPDLPRKAAPGFDKAGGKWVIFPPLAYRNHIQIEADLISLSKDFASCGGNRLSGSGTRGIAAGGVSYAYAREALEGIAAEYKLLKAGVFPFPEELGLAFLEGLAEVLVLEELDPVIEEELIRLCGRRRLGVAIRGKISGHIPRAGENTAALIGRRIRSFLAGEPDLPPGSAAIDLPEAPVPGLPARPPVLCAGCPHRGAFFAVKEGVRRGAGGRKAVFSGDIGCYTLGNARPLDMVDTCLCMGAGITIAQGINRVEPDTLNFAFIGDSTFFHTGIPGIVNALYNQGNMVVVILDNYTTAMTGNQPHPGTGKTAGGAAVNRISIPAILSALGVEPRRANPFDLPDALTAVREVLDKKGLRVILFEGPCIAVSRGEIPCEVLGEKCTGCMVCIRTFGCPAISAKKKPGAGGAAAGLAAVIDPALCTGCGVCRDLCPAGAILNRPGSAPEGRGNR